MGGLVPPDRDVVLGGLAPTAFDFMDYSIPLRPGNVFDPTKVRVYLISDNTRDRVAAARAAATTAALPTPSSRASLVSDTACSRAAAACAAAAAVLVPTLTQKSAPIASVPAPESPAATQQYANLPWQFTSFGANSPNSPEIPPSPPRSTDTTTIAGKPGADTKAPPAPWVTDNTGDRTMAPRAEGLVGYLEPTQHFTRVIYDRRVSVDAYVTPYFL